MALFPQHGRRTHHASNPLALRLAEIENDLLSSPGKIKTLTVGMQKQMSKRRNRPWLYETREQPALLGRSEIRIMLRIKLVQQGQLIDIGMGHWRRQCTFNHPMRREPPNHVQTVITPHLRFEYIAIRNFQRFVMRGLACFSKNFIQGQKRFKNWLEFFIRKLLAGLSEPANNHIQSHKTSPARN